MQQVSVRSVPLTALPEASQEKLDGQAHSFHRLMAKNEVHLAEFDRNPLFQLVGSSLFSSEKVRSRFLDCLQVWSDKYQKMVLARSIFCEAPRFQGITTQHLQEEFGHNTALETMRDGRPVVWDPVLEAASTWFTWKILTLSEIERILLVHTVVETSATVFYKHVRPAIQAKRDPHFSQHEVVDHDHQNMGLDELRNLRDEEYVRLEQLQSEGWAMLNVVMTRIAELTQAAFPVN